MFVVDCYGHNFSNGVLFAYHIVVDAPGGSSNLGYRRHVRMSNNPTTRVNPRRRPTAIRRMKFRS